MDLHEFARLLRRSWAIIVVTLSVFVIIGAAYTIASKPSYSAESTAYLSPPAQANANATDLSQGVDFVQTAVKSYATVTTSTYVLQDVKQRLRLPQSVAQLKQQVSAVAPVDTTLLQVTATAGSPTEAAAIANAVTAQLSSAVQRLNPSAARVDVSQIDPAIAPASPSSPNVPLNFGLAIILGLVVGLGLAVLRQRLDTRLRDRDQAQEIVHAPVLGEILEDRRAASRPLIAIGDDDSRGAEAYRSLRTNLEFLDFDRRARSFVVTSSIPREGKSLTVANLAVFLAEAGRSVVVVDADLRRPRLGAVFGLEDRVGLTDVLLGTVEVEQALQRWGGPKGPLVLPSGRIPPNPSELLQSDTMHRLISHLEQRYDVVLFDTPPVVAVSDAVILTRRTGGALLLAAVGRTRRTDLRRAIDNLRQVDGSVLGLVLTMVPPRQSIGYSYQRSNKPAPPRSGDADTESDSRPPVTEAGSEGPVPVRARR